jgi:hypothetical protein
MYLFLRNYNQDINVYYSECLLIKISYFKVLAQEV